MAIEIGDDGKITLPRASWDFKRDPGDEYKCYISPDDIGRIARAVEGLPIDVPQGDRFSSGSAGSIPEGEGPKMPAEVKTLAAKIAAAGWMTHDQAQSLIMCCGVSRVRDVSNWIGRKISNGELVSAPGRLLQAQSMKKSSQDAPRATIEA